MEIQYLKSLPYRRRLTFSEHFARTEGRSFSNRASFRPVFLVGGFLFLRGRVLEQSRESVDPALLPFVVLAGGSVLAATCLSWQAMGVLLSPHSGLWIAVILIAFMSMVKVAMGGRPCLEHCAAGGTTGGVSPLATNDRLHRQLRVLSSPEYSSLSTLQSSTCVCVNHQPPQHMNREEDSAKAPVTSVVPVLHGRESCWAVATGGSKSFSRKRVLARLSGGPP